MQESSTNLDRAGEDFETVYRRLEETVDQLETGGLSLEESIRLYEEGMRLARRCKELLDAAELRISQLQQEFAGDGLEASLSEEPA